MNRAVSSMPATSTAWLSPPAGAGVLIGREAELESAARLLREPTVRLLTFTGAGGVGKTRLAVEVARVCGSEFDNGGCFVPLSRLTAAHEALPAIGRALGFVGSAAPDL